MSALAMLARATPHSIMAQTIQSNAIPISFGGDAVVYAINLAGMTVLAYLGFGMVAWMARLMWRNRRWDRLRHPITLVRAIVLLAATSLTIRSGGEMANLWAWDPRDPNAGAAVMRIVRYTNAFSLIFAVGWLALAVVAMPAVKEMLIRQPFPVRWRAELPSLRKPLKIAVMAIIMSVGVVWLRVCSCGHLIGTRRVTRTAGCCKPVVNRRYGRSAKCLI